MAVTVPASIVSRMYNTTHFATLAIGTNKYPPKADVTTSFYWYTVVSLLDLSVPDVAVSTANDTVPANIAKYLGNTDFFLFFASNAQRSGNFPHGPLATFLNQVGTGPAFARGEQMIDQLGTGSIQNFSYVLGATMNTGDLPGFELFSPDIGQILTMSFLQTTRNGKTFYIPIQTGASGGATLHHEK
jgi:hypothetical protein